MSGRAATTTLIRGRAALSVGLPEEDAPTGWAWTSLYDVAELGTGHTPSRSVPSYWDGDVPWIGIRDAARHHGGRIGTTQQTITEAGLENSSARLLPAGTVCLSRTASVGYVIQMDRPMATSQDFVTWTCVEEGLDPRFLMYALLAEGDDIRRFGKGTTHTTIYFPEVKAFHICLPPLAEQRRIVAKLDALTARTARARADLDRIPALAARYKQAVLAKAFSGELIGAVSSWPTKSIGDLIDRVVGGKNLRCEERPPQPNELGVVKVSAVSWGAFNPQASKTLPIDFSPPEHTRISIGDFLISRANTLELVGAVVVVDQTPGNLFLSDKVLRLEMPDERKRWLMWFLRSPQARAAIEAGSSGNQLSMRNLSQDALKKIPVPWPDREVRRRIVERIERAFVEIDRMTTEAAAARRLLDRLDQALLAKAFRGELVPQDPADEPASVLLDRIRAERASAPKATRGRRRAVA